MPPGPSRHYPRAGCGVNGSSDRPNPEERREGEIPKKYRQTRQANVTHQSLLDIIHLARLSKLWYPSRIQRVQSIGALYCVVTLYGVGGLAEPQPTNVPIARTAVGFPNALPSRSVSDHRQDGARSANKPAASMPQEVVELPIAVNRAGNSADTESRAACPSAVLEDYAQRKAFTLGLMEQRERQ